MIIQAANRLKDVSEYYFSAKLREIAEMRESGIDVINLGIGSPDLAPSEATTDALIASARKPGNHAYQPYKGTAELRSAMAGWYEKTYGVKPDAGTEILPLLGSKEGILHITMAFLNPGDEALVPDPGYPTYTSVAKLAGATAVPYNLTEANNYQPDSAELEKITGPKTRLMWVNYPHMPTGTPAAEDAFEELVAFARRKSILLVNDNPYSLVLNASAPKSILQCAGAAEVALELNSLSKSHNMAGWRVGMVCGAREYIETMLKVKSNMDSGMFLPVQQAAVAALSNSDGWHRSRNNEYAKRKALACRLLDAMGCTYRSGQEGMFLWARIPEGEESGEAFAGELLKRAHVFITPGFIFGKNGVNHVRVSLCSGQGLLREAIERIEKGKGFTQRAQRGVRKER